jgi:uncharacterized protein YdeI (YjbR/CyaY-like superfamily)
MTVHFFETQELFREWLELNHECQSELIVGFYKIGSGKPSITWSQSVDQALCFGWIDGIRRSIDHESYSIRFTPRKQNSIWSAVNIKKVDELTKSGMMRPAGLKAYSFRKEENSMLYSHENPTMSLSDSFEKQFKKNEAAWDFFDRQAPSYKKVMIHWIMSAKQEKTRQARLEKTIDQSSRQIRMDTWKPSKSSEEK